ncbi:MAG: ATP-dependent sacrificial sulfur transferase LarE [Crenarchaeota archaeon]|nr:ATP-dependent sacrificial sulfur transferase LarE [Thermoproteota archaeon]MDA1124959.1 ATP-dependent sacrificial sulfur transferase LarE [Thermoproteota archaeon]
MTDLNQLLEWFTDKDKVLVSLSGGVDSALVAYAANKKLGKNAIAVTADYKTLSSEELDSAKLIAREIGITHQLIEYSELENENFVKNDNKRCFYCRDELSKELIKLANSLGIKTIVDGTQIDDMGDYRPGIDALHGNGIRSPLLEIKFTKELVRRTAKHIGLSIYDKPSNSCLASRIPWGQRVTAESLVRIELAEKIIKQKTGIQQIRVRDIDGLARIEVQSNQLTLLDNANTRDEIFQKLKMIGFSDVEINSNGYVSGSLNIIVKN